MTVLFYVLAGFAALPDTVALSPEALRPGQVFYTMEEAEAIAARLKNHAWARAARDRLLERADALVSMPLDIPHKEGQWWHWYVCAEDHATLQAKSATEHRCPVCGTVYTGEPFDSVYVSMRHGAWFEGVETLGWAYTVSGDARYAERVRAILLEYASFYRDLALHDPYGAQTQSGARLFSQTLEEAQALCRAALAYDRVYGAACLTDADRASIAAGLLRPMVETIRSQPPIKGNWQVWHDAGAGCAGFVLGDPELVHWAVNPPHGLLAQLREHVGERGLWFEGSLRYHFYVLTPFVYLFEALARAGVDLYAEGKVRRLFEAPLDTLLPSLELPPLNDTSREPISVYRAVFEPAQRRYPDAPFASILQPRDTTWALAWGPETTAKPARLAPGSVNFAEDGLAILRDTAGDIAAYLDYGPADSRHAQHARLNLMLYSQGDVRFVDPGTPQYGADIYDTWFRQTVAHNTLVMNGRSHARSRGAVEVFAAGDRFSAVQASCVDAYEGVTIRRSLVLHENLLIDVVNAYTSRPNTFDLPLHVRGTLEGLPAAEPHPPLGELDGYQHLANTVRFTTPPESFYLDAGEGRRTYVRLYSPPETFMADGPGEHPGERLPVILRRVQDRDATFVTICEMLDAGEAPADISVREGYGIAVSVGAFTADIGSDVMITLDGMRYYLGAEGVLRTLPVPGYQAPADR